MGSNNRYVKKEASISGNVPRSKFPLDHRVLGSYLHGYLYPCGAPIEVLPGDTFKCDIAHLTRMSTPIFPIMDNIYQHYAAFFVPKRLVWDKTKQFYGEASDFGIASSVLEPTSGLPSNVLERNPSTPYVDQGLYTKTFASHFGLVVTSLVAGQNTDPVNLLPIRAFMLVYNEHFRDQNFCPKYIFDKTQVGNDNTRTLATRGGLQVYGQSPLPLVKKESDLFVNALPWAQKGSPVTLFPGTTTLDVDIDADGSLSFTANTQYKSQVDLLLGENPISGGASAGGRKELFGYNRDASNAVPGGTDLAYKSGLTGVIDDLSAINVSVNDLRFACAYQLYLEKLGHFGSRYGEQIKALFGVNISDNSAQIPEFLGHMSTRINVDQVLQTTGHAAGTSSTLGQLGANSVTGTNKHLFVKSFDEPGYVVIVTYFKHDRTYAQGLDPIFMKNDLLDYYQPPFANLGDMPISKSRIHWDGTNHGQSFGFQEPWSEYRSIADRCYGLLDPSVPNSLDFMTLSEKFGTAPILGQQFVEEDRNNIARALTTGTAGPDYICDTLVKIEAVRCMPLWANHHIGVL